MDAKEIIFPKKSVHSLDEKKIPSSNMKWPDYLPKQRRDGSEERKKTLTTDHQKVFFSSTDLSEQFLMRCCQSDFTSLWVPVATSSDFYETHAVMLI